MQTPESRLIVAGGWGRRKWRVTTNFMGWGEEGEQRGREMKNAWN